MGDYQAKLKSAFFVLVLMAGTAQAANLAPHRAIYDLTTSDVSDKSPFKSAEGRMAYEVQGSECEGWAISYRIANRYANRDGSMQVYDTQVTSWEANDGTEFRYNQKLFLDNTLNGEVKITVERGKEGEAAEGNMAKGSDTKFKIPADTFFTMNHQARVLDLAAKGEARDSSLVFDGSDDDKTYRIITFIGKQKQADVPTAAQVIGGDELKSLKSWPVTMSYYPADNEQADEPTYQSTLNLLENGVATSVDINYGTHKVQGALKSLEMLPKQKCN